MACLSLSMALGALNAESAEQSCVEAGALAVTFTDLQDDAVLEPAPGEVRLWPATRLQALFDSAIDTDLVLNQLSAALGVPASAMRLEAVADRVWEREWLRDFHAMRFGQRLWVSPHHETVSEPAAVVVKLDPGLAFGTGTHASTALCLSWLDGHLRPGARVIDYGCGSGILGIAAILLGAASCQAFDIDPQALLATDDNAARNGVPAAIRACASAAQLQAGADVVLANILAATLIDLAPELTQLVRPAGQLVLAGILTEQAAAVTAAFAACFDMQLAGQREGWVLLAGVRRAC
jgi:ribosomal protein L11 methyltransferase